eukprot:1142912-Pelagomonas_calceolata.AAC.20
MIRYHSLHAALTSKLFPWQVRSTAALFAAQQECVHDNRLYDLQREVTHNHLSTLMKGTLASRLCSAVMGQQQVDSVLQGLSEFLLNDPCAPSAAVPRCRALNAAKRVLVNIYEEAEQMCVPHTLPVRWLSKPRQTRSNEAMEGGATTGSSCSRPWLRLFGGIQAAPAARAAFAGLASGHVAAAAGTERQGTR